MTSRQLSHICASVMFLVCFGSFGWAETYNAKPWLEDLDRFHAALKEKDANYSWLIEERQLDLADVFARARSRIIDGKNDFSARAAFDRLTRRLHDGHLALEWPEDYGGNDKNNAKDTCGQLGFDAEAIWPDIVNHLPGYVEVSGAHVLPAGMIKVGSERVGAIRLGMFSPAGYPVLCERALRDIVGAHGKDCGSECAERVMKHAYAQLTEDLETSLAAFRKAGCTTLLIDVTGNGGGSEWAEAVARIVGGSDLKSERLAFVRGPHWAKNWRDTAQALRTAAAYDSSHRDELLGWAMEAERGVRAAETRSADDSPLAQIGFSTGLVGAAPANKFANLSWASLVWSPAEYSFHDGVWHGPTIVLVDDDTFSAAEEFAAVLQDNHAATIMGARTGGAGCGHTNGGTPTTLPNSGAIVEVSDCVRLRNDGSNEVNGVMPDVLLPMRADDGIRMRVRMVEADLPRALTLAEHR